MITNMNKNIEALYEQAQEVSHYTDGGYTKIYKLNAKKFAELIIQECLNQCYNRGMNDVYYGGQLRAAQYIEQHFEVTQ